MRQKYSRREFLYQHILGTAALAGGGWFLAACKLAPATARTGTDEAVRQEQPPIRQNAPQPNGPGNSPATTQPTPRPAAAAPGENPCDDLTGVPPGELDKRKKFAYVPVSPQPDSRCGNCKLFLPPASGKACGGCLLFKGPVREAGYCTYWAPLE